MHRYTDGTAHFTIFTSQYTMQMKFRKSKKNAAFTEHGKRVQVLVQVKGTPRTN